MKTARDSVPVLIAGAGLAGLSTAYHLRDTRSLVVEREPHVGGTARSFPVDKFTFDVTGHLLHLHHDYTRRLISDLLDGQFFRCERRTWIFSEGAYTRYPFQANTFGLSEKTVDACVLGFLDAYYSGARNAPNLGRRNFRDWSRAVFGDGISEHFMIPYNEKLYQTRATRLTADWCGRFVPQVRPEEVMKGALQPQSKRFGYNATFWYPKRGGIQILSSRLAERVKRVETGVSLEWVDWRARRARLSDGREIDYRRLVSTLPLPELLRRLQNPPVAIRRAAGRLRYASVLCLNIGVSRPRISDASWIYFPESRFPFYRVGFPMNFTPHVVPQGCSSMYVEIPMSWASGKSESAIMRVVRSRLIDAGILKPSDRFPVIQFLPIRYAYVVYDRNRQAALDVLFPFLERNGILSIGRYGGWKYSFMEEAIRDGQAAAETLLRSNPR